MRIDYEIKWDFDDVLISPKRSTLGSRADVDLVRTFKMPNAKQELTGIGVIAANMDTTGTIAMCETLSKLQAFTCLHKFYEPEKLIEFFQTPASDYAFYTLGITKNDFDKLYKVSQHVKLTKICLDVANGYSEYFVNKVKEVRKAFPTAIIMAGNVATPEMVQELIIAGTADIVKVGIGGGSVCTTRMVAGVGIPQLSACIECADVAHGLGGHVCSDGGCKKPADVVKAFAAGSDFTMLGGLLAGTDQCEGEWEYEYKSTRRDVNGVPIYDGSMVKKALKFYGMSSQEAMDKYNGGVSAYKAAEGECISTPYKGSAESVMQQILGGLRSACSYVGTSKLKDLSKCTTFVRVNRVK